MIIFRPVKICVFILSLIACFSSCLYEPYAAATINNNTNNSLIVTLNLDTAVLRKWGYYPKAPQAVFERLEKQNQGEETKFKIDSINNLVGTTIINPGHALTLYENRNVRPDFIADKITIANSDRIIFIYNKSTIENAFLEKEDGHFELDVN